MSSKQGQNGNRVELLTNYFSFRKKADFTVFKYRSVHPLPSP
jgi:hypothetical protein